MKNCETIILRFHIGNKVYFHHVSGKVLAQIPVKTLPTGISLFGDLLMVMDNVVQSLQYVSD